MTFEQWWDTVAKTPAPDTFKNWEESCRQAWAAGAANEKRKNMKIVGWRNPMNGVVISTQKKDALLSVGNGYPNFSEPVYAV